MHDGLRQVDSRGVAHLTQDGESVFLTRSHGSGNRDANESERVGVLACLGVAAVIGQEIAVFVGKEYLVVIVAVVQHRVGAKLDSGALVVHRVALVREDVNHFEILAVSGLELKSEWLLQLHAASVFGCGVERDGVEGVNVVGVIGLENHAVVAVFPAEVTLNCRLDMECVFGDRSVHVPVELKDNRGVGL